MPPCRFCGPARGRRGRHADRDHQCTISGMRNGLRHTLGIFRVPLRFPNIRFALSEGGIGWVPMLLDRFEYMTDHAGRAFEGWPAGSATPSEVLQNNFWFCALDDPSTIGLRGRIGVEHILFESDYPHADSTWPDTQAAAKRLLQGVPDSDVRKILSENAARLFRHPLPSAPSQM